MCSFLVNVLASVVATAIAGFAVWKFDWFNIRKDRAIRHAVCRESARACIGRWQNRLSDAGYSKACGLHSDSLPEIETVVYALLGFGENTALQEAWQNYSKLEPTTLPKLDRSETQPAEDAFNTGAARQMPEGGREAINRTLDSLIIVVS